MGGNLKRLVAGVGARLPAFSPVKARRHAVLRESIHDIRRRGSDRKRINAVILQPVIDKEPLFAAIDGFPDTVDIAAHVKYIGVYGIGRARPEPAAAAPTAMRPFLIARFHRGFRRRARYGRFHRFLLCRRRSFRAHDPDIGAVGNRLHERDAVVDRHRDDIAALALTEFGRLPGFRHFHLQGERLIVKLGVGITRNFENITVPP